MDENLIIEGNKLIGVKNILTKEIIIPEGIEELRKFTFYNCKSLEKITLPSTLKKIGLSAFENCQSLEKVTLPSTLKNIGNAAFYNCKSLKEIVIPEEVEYIEDNTFKNCQRLEKVTLPSTLKNIGNHVFESCQNLKEIVIPEGVEYIGDFAFENCHSLKKATLPSTLKNIGNAAFENCENLKEIEIPEGVEYIVDYAFYNCQSLEKVTLPSTLKRIASSTFENCYNLKEIKISEGVEYIENNAFENCRNLKKVTLPSTLKNISAFVFKNCENLKEIKLNNYIIENGYELPIENIFDKAKAQFFKQINENIDINLEYEYQKGKNLKIFVDTIIDDLLKGNITYEEFMILVNKFKIVLKSIPLKNFLPYEVINKMDEQLLEKFDFKLWVKLIRNPLYTINEETKNSLIELIGIFGLFEQDEERDKRLYQFYKMFEEDYLIEPYEELEINKEEIEKYVKKKRYRIKDGVKIPEKLKKYLEFDISEERYKKLRKKTGSIGKEINEFLKNNYEEYEQEYVKLKESKEIYEKLINKEIKGKINKYSIHQMFSGCKQEYNRGFYEFIKEHFEEILENEIYQSRVKDISHNYEIIKNYFLKWGNKDFGIEEAIIYLEELGFKNIQEGNEEFAKMVKNAGVVSQEAFEYYQRRYEEIKEKRESKIPVYQKEFTIKKGEKEYQIEARILEKNDPMQLLVGEVNYANNCQVYSRNGQSCVDDIGKNSGIFCLYEKEEGKYKLLAESWLWINEHVLCFDNIEGTKLLKKEDKKEIVREVYKKVGEELVEDENIDKVIIGVKYDDANLKKEYTQEINSIRSKNRGYTDAKVVVKIAEKKNRKTEEEKIYEDPRKIEIKRGREITTRMIQKIKRIEEKAHKKEMQTLQEVKTKEEFYEVLGEEEQNINVIIGEDFYYIYTNDGKKINIYDLAKEEARKNEKDDQIKEIREGFKYILKESLKTESEIIEAELREDTSYILYLWFIKSKVIESIGKEKLEMLKEIKKIREENKEKSKPKIYPVKFKVNKEYLLEKDEIVKKLAKR